MPLHNMPQIAFGTGSKWKGQDVTDYVTNAIETGFSHIDTAQFYANEESVAAAIRETGLDRSDVFITTKWSSQAGVRESLERSLAKASWDIRAQQQLELTQVDLYLIHNPALAKDYESDWRDFEAVREAGLTKYAPCASNKIHTNHIVPSPVGASQMQKLWKIAKVKPAANQIQFHPYNYAGNKDLLAFCQQHGVVVEAYSSLSPITRYPGGPVDKPVNAAAKRLGATATQVILSWVKAKGVVIVTTSSSREHMQEYLDVGDLRALTEDEIAAIDAAGARGPPSTSAQDPRILGRNQAPKTSPTIAFFAPEANLVLYTKR
ncbi:predicted protein [Postia placenta Mad-698-R]|uniref:NADP-dependent oxidoreductase domain-containing protein n=1 Tax=Postia placenta MAD-698-R-SB12 TaxID=670580 RepID=A0A1X6MLP1_9APHY|nr:hypothetical protein POSPLADRAFT_1157242 [Postia placenta MAD-698-R-SB12]EED77286.1 predicted protein [Postia placenta Mad-698-R]OSX57324.1 hypothetical protein POSPLADRAFT_1157242 [Postia placenta MAD-698-R-SB12]